VLRVIGRRRPEPTLAHATQAPRNNTFVECCDDIAHLIGGDPLLVHGEHRGTDEVLENGAFAAVFERLNFDLARCRCGDCTEVAHAWHDFGFAGTQRTAQCVGGKHLAVADRQTNRHTTALVHLAA